MTPETIRTFLRQYIGSLVEESRQTKDGRRFGFDYLIEQLGAAESWSPYRAPSHVPEATDELPKPKKEAEHGVDYAFVSGDRATLIVFVLKDEALTYKNFEDHRFGTDIRRAARPDLSVPELSGIRQVRIILAYNKGDEEEGVEEFDRQAQSLGSRAGDHATLAFERWNLDRLVELVEAKLLSAAVLPPNFFRRLTYICWQVGDFTHGSGQWEEVLLPDWKEFLEQILEGEVTTRSVWMVAVALPIVQKHGKAEPAFETGWIELLEWAMLALWNGALRCNRSPVANAVKEIWVQIYMTELDRFYHAHAADLGLEDSLSRGGDAAFEPVVQSYLAFWHLGRLGILWQTLAELEFRPEATAAVEARTTRLFEICQWMHDLTAANPGATRPMLDSHHIELYLFWIAFYRTRQPQVIAHWLNELYHHLLMRRREGGPLRLIASDNDWDSVFEMIVENEPPEEGYGRTSYLLMMLEELCFCLPSPAREKILEGIHEHVVVGRDVEGESFEYQEKIELTGWAPPKDWEKMTLAGELDSAPNRGVALTTGNFERYPGEPTEPIAKRVEEFIAQTRQRYPLQRETSLPLSVLFLACIKHRTPVPAEFWRAQIFGPLPGSVDEVPK